MGRLDSADDQICPGCPKYHLIAHFCCTVDFRSSARVKDRAPLSFCHRVQHSDQLSALLTLSGDDYVCRMRIRVTRPQMENTAFFRLAKRC